MAAVYLNMPCVDVVCVDEPCMRFYVNSEYYDDDHAFEFRFIEWQLLIFPGLLNLYYFLLLSIFIN